MAAGDRAAERTALADEVLLADELVERARAHPGGEGLALGRRPEQGFGPGAGDGAPGRHGPMVARAGSADRDHLRDVDQDPEGEQDREQERRDARDVLDVAGDVGRTRPLPGRRGCHRCRPRARACLVRRRTASAARSSASSCASISAARRVSASVSPLGRGATTGATDGTGAGGGRGRRSMGRRWPGRTLPRARFAMAGFGASTGAVAAGAGPSAERSTPGARRASGRLRRTRGRGPGHCPAKGAGRLGPPHGGPLGRPELVLAQHRRGRDRARDHLSRCWSSRWSG